MPVIRVLFLWHMHQPFYKDLVAGEYRLPWVRMHALKDYYGMVKLLDEFPEVHQTFNLVPSLMTQIQEYAGGEARDPFLDVASKPADELTYEERLFALRYLFQANTENIVRRYPRYAELHRKLETNHFDPNNAQKYFQLQDYRDLQVLSQLSWFDEFFLEDRDVAALVAKERGYSEEDQQFVTRKQREICASVLPAYASAAQRGLIELSTSPFYHPILPLLCDTDQGRVSCPGLPLPRRRFQYPDDAREQLRRGLDLHEQVFGTLPVGVWPSEGSVSEEAIGIAHSLGVKWMATDEGVLGHSIAASFDRSRDGVLHGKAAENLYNIYRYEKGGTEMHMVFRDHSLSDLIGFVYSGMTPADAVKHFMQRLKASAEPVLAQGKDAVISVILDGENAWEFFPKSGREFLRRLYSTLRDDKQVESVTVSEAITKHSAPARLDRVVPGSWINANFNVWIGAPEDNKAWDYLTDAREEYSRRALQVPEEQRKLAYEELLIAEGSDWNWWYGPEHHSSNDADFDDLYRKHLTNVYTALGLRPPDYLAQPIATGTAKAKFFDQTAYIHPRVDGESVGYFDWIGAAHYIPDHHQSAMHGKRFLINSAYAGIDENNLYCRVDFADELFDPTMELIGDFLLAINVERKPAAGGTPEPKIRIELNVKSGKLVLTRTHCIPETLSREKSGLVARLGRVLEMQLSLDFLQARVGDTLGIRFAIWENGAPVDSLPAEGDLDLRVRTAEELAALTSGDLWSA